MGDQFSGFTTEMGTYVKITIPKRECICWDDYDQAEKGATFVTTLTSKAPVRRSGLTPKDPEWLKQALPAKSPLAMKPMTRPREIPSDPRPPPRQAVAKADLHTMNSLEMNQVRQSY